MMKLDCCFTTDVGKVRKNNEDNFYLNGNYKRVIEHTEYEKSDLLYSGGIFAICDGMGGEEYGEKAALITLETLKEYQSKDFKKHINEFINLANKKICQLINENNGVRSGTTIALLHIFDNKFVSYNIGDSRVYMFRKGKLSQISEDHTQTSQMLKMGVITKEQALTHKDRHILTQHLGIFPDELIISAHKSDEIELRNEDILLLCSDGLTDMLSDREIEETLKEKRSAAEHAKFLKHLAIEKGGKDNVTVGVIKVIGRKEGLLEIVRRLF